MLVHNSHTNVTVTRDDAANKIIFSVDPYDGDITGSVFADDSTILVDGVSGTIPYPANAGVVWDGNAPTTVDVALDRLAAYTQNSPSLTGDFTGSLFADDSTLLVDGVAGKIVGDIESTSILPGDVSTDIGSTSNRFYNAWFTGQIETDSINAAILYGPLTGDVTGNVSGTAGAVAFSGITGKPTTLAGYGITDAATSAQGALAASALQAETITLATLKTEVAASTDFADFQARIAAL
jgi:hypothetical protein